MEDLPEDIMSKDERSDQAFVYVNDLGHQNKIESGDFEKIKQVFQDLQRSNKYLVSEVRKYRAMYESMKHAFEFTITKAK